MRQKRRRIFAFIAMVLLISFVYYFSLNLQVAQSHKNLLEDNSVNPSSQENEVTTSLSQLGNVTKTTLFVPTSPATLTLKPLSISDSFRKSIPQNSAFWNRKLGFLIKQLDKGVHLAEKSKPDWFNCRETNRELLKTNIHDFSGYPNLHKDFLLGMDCRDPPILINQPNKCSGAKKNDHLLLFAIKSSLKNFEQRQAVRETWGREGEYGSGVRVRTVFLLGTSSKDNPDLGPLISFEADYYKDILQWDFHESFFNLTLKELMFYKWAMEHCAGVSFVFKGDDDVFVNRGAVIYYLRSVPPNNTSQTYMGQVIYSATPLRNPQSKYFIPLTFYDGPYPAYAGGGGYLFSGTLIPSLHRISKFIPLFPIDDVYTGMCFHALGITPKQHAGFKTFDIQEQDRENLCIHKGLMLVHQRSPQQVIKLWKGVNSPLLTC